MPLDFNADPAPPRLALPVAVGLGKSTAAHRGIAKLLHKGTLGRRKVIYGVPRLDLADEQCRALQALGIKAMVWRGRSAPDPTAGNSEQLMCLDPSAPFDAMEVECVVEQTACRVIRNGMMLVCPLHGQCGYQAQKPAAGIAQVIVTAHDTLFHGAPREIGAVGLLVLDEGFWAAGLRGLDGKAVLTLDGLRPTLGTVQCYTAYNQPEWEATADLGAARGLLSKMLDLAPNGPLSITALRATGLTPEQCRKAAGLEHRRLRNPGLLPGMDPAERRRRIDRVMPKHNEPWAPPGRADAMWHLIAAALEGDHDVAGAVLFDAMTENGTVRSLRLAWRAKLRKGWGALGPILHLDATMRPDLIVPFVPDMAFAESLMATEPYVRVRQILRAPTSAKALTPLPEAAARERDAAAGHLRELATLIALRAMELRGRSAARPDLLVIAQKAALDALRAIGMPANVATVHFNALSGIDRWRDVAGLMILGRTLPTPATVETIAAAVTNRPPLESRGTVSWWYGSVERRIGLADGGVHVVQGEAHADPTAEAVRWTGCEGELIQAIGRGRGVNRTADTPLEVDLLTDVVLPVTVHEVLAWDDTRPTRHDAMLAAGVVLENAADMAKAFPDLWATRDAAKKQNQRRGTNCYYRGIHNSDLTPSSAVVTYRSSGAGQKDREARFDLVLIPDPRAWLEARLGPLAHFAVTGGDVPVAAPPATTGLSEARARLRASLNAMIQQRATIDRDRLTDLSMRLDAAILQRLATDRGRLAALSARLEAAKPTTAAA